MPVKGLSQFNTEVARFSATLRDEEVPIFQARVCLELLKRVVEKNPVDTGRSRANWQVTIDAPVNSIVTYNKKKKISSAQANAIVQNIVSNGEKVLTQLKPFAQVYIQNNINYISYLEAGRSRAQAPKGMVAVSIQEVLQIFG